MHFEIAILRISQGCFLVLYLATVLSLLHFKHWASFCPVKNKERPSSFLYEKYLSLYISHTPTFKHPGFSSKMSSEDTQFSSRML